MKRSEFIQNAIGVSLMTSLASLGATNESVKQRLKRSADDGHKKFDVIVLGVGSMGSSTCYYLAKQGMAVLGLEQFDIPNEKGSHAGQSRLIRKAYFEHPDYVPLLRRAYENWKELESVSGAQVYFKTGLLYFGRPDHLLIKGVHTSARKYKIAVDGISGTDMKIKFPQVKVPNDYKILHEPDAGFITPERAILLYAEKALQHGAIIKTKIKVFHWKRTTEGIEVTTSAGTYFGKKLVITAGPWAGKMIPGLSTTLTITRQMVAWVLPKESRFFEFGKFPCWIAADDSKPGIYYGFPMLPVGKFGGPIGFKLAHHYHGAVSDPDTVDRIPTADDEGNLLYALNKFFPESYAATHVIKSCMYTNTPDENFIVDFLPDYDDDVIIAAGFSGHGFKFASAIGQVMSDLAIKGNTTLPIGFLKAGRFKS